MKTYWYLVPATEWIYGIPEKLSDWTLFKMNQLSGLVDISCSYEMNGKSNELCEIKSEMAASGSNSKLSPALASFLDTMEL